MNGSDASDLEESRERPIELLTWWSWARSGQGDLFSALMRAHAKRFPRDTLINASSEESGTARKALRARMFIDDPPDTFEANIGTDHMQWVRVNGLDAKESKLLPLDDLVPEVGEWRRVYPQPLLDLLSFGGKMYAAPINTHRINCLFYNTAIFHKYGLFEPKTPEDLFALAKKLEGTNINLLAVGSRDPWTVALLIFESLLVAKEGRDFYDDYFSGQLRGDDPRIESTLNLGFRLLELANQNHRQLSWIQAVELVTRGRAAMTVMGDWSKVTFEVRGFQLGREYQEIGFPGSEETFVFTSDTFSLPVKAKNIPGAILKHSPKP